MSVRFADDEREIHAIGHHLVDCCEKHNLDVLNVIEILIYISLKSSASSLSLSGWWHISRMGFRYVEICTGPVVPRGGNLTAGSGFTALFLLVAGIGMCICIGAVGGFEMIA